MRIEYIGLVNWLPFRGEHCVVLGAKSYGVHGPNWNGKSAFLESVDFALHGRHQHSPSASKWISYGEDHGMVELGLSGGVTVRRERLKNASTKLSVTLRDDVARVLMDAEAQAWISKAVGCTADDFLNTCFFKQKKAAQFITCDPGARMDVVSAWLNLLPLQKGEAKLREQVTALSGRLVRLRNELSFSRATEARALETVGPDLVASIAAVGVELGKARGRLSSLHNLLGKNDRLRDLAGAKQKHAEACAQRDALMAEYAKVDVSEIEKTQDLAEREWRRVSDELAVVRVDLSVKKNLARGEFDGCCPVSGGQCPAADYILSKSKENVEAYKTTSQAAAELDKIVETLASETKAAQVRVRAHDRLARNLADAVALVKLLEPKVAEAESAPPPEDVQDLRARITAEQETVAQLTGKLAALKQAEHSVAVSRDEQESRIAEITILEEELAKYRAGCLILGPRGAQRRAAEAALAEIQEGANDMLRECAIPLSVRMSWCHEGKDLAKTCDACGSPFPASEKVKACERCGAARGQQLVNKLIPELSDRSGAAEDLVGIAFQLSAAQWLRHHRSVNWETVEIDEPFGHLDADNCRALSAHLAALLSARYGFTQSLVVAHNSSSLDALPGRIEVVREGSGSSVRVVA